MFLNVTILTPEEIIFEGKALSLVLPGEQGVFEILPFHKQILSRLVTGILIVNEESMPIKRGVVQFNQNRAVVIIEK